MDNSRQTYDLTLSIEEINEIFNNELQMQVEGLLPKDTCEWLNWISQGKALYLDKKKIQILINQQRINLAEVEYLDLDLIESIIDTFQNPL